MKVYVATSFSNLELAKTAIAALKADNHEITHDWTNENSNLLKGDELQKYLTKCAAQDVEGVVTCDVMLLLNHTKCRGAFTELGIAIGHNKPVVVVWPEAVHNIFFNVPGITCVESLGDALAFINKIEKVP